MSDWKLISQNRLIKYLSDELVIIKNSNFNPIPFDCSVCCLSLRDRADIISYKNYGCCTDCNLLFVQPNKNAWKKGWRPDKDAIKVKLRYNYNEKGDKS